MKYLIVLGDGMADEPIDALNGLTPMQAAHTPVMDFLAREGRCGGLETVPEGFAPGSEIANMSLLGYDVRTQFEGRGSLEAASMGVDIPDGWMAARCNLICVENDCIKNHSAGHISNEAACVYVNVSTAFTDGGQFGFGAEIGISTQKMHARGPMALPELCSYKYLIESDTFAIRNS